MGLQQPATQPLLEIVQRVARRRLLNLRQQAFVEAGDGFA